MASERRGSSAERAVHGAERAVFGAERAVLDSAAERAVLLEKLEGQDKVLAQILSQSKLTNGRVTELEKAKAIQDDREQRGNAKHAWQLTLSVGILGALGGVGAALAAHLAG